MLQGLRVRLRADFDRCTALEWIELGIDERVFVDDAPSPRVTGFEVTGTGPRRVVTYDCACTEAQAAPCRRYTAGRVLSNTSTSG